MPDHAAALVDELNWSGYLAAAIDGERVAPAFQPIVDLQRGVITGYEALARFTDGPPVTPDRWFAEAARRGCVAELEAAVLRAALAHRADLPPNAFMSVNIEPESLLDPFVMRLLGAHAPLDGLVVEVTEHHELVDRERSIVAMEHLHDLGALLAVDDAGAGYAGLAQTLTLRPQILKLDRALVEGVDTDEAKAALIEMLGVFANRIDAWILAEGIETRAEADRCRALGVPLAQGFFFGSPAPPFAPLESEAANAIAHDAERDRGLRPLLVAAPSVGIDAVDDATAVFAASEARHVVVVRDGRPVGILTPAALLEGDLLDAPRANADSEPAEVAHRIATRANGDTYLPIVVTDNAGRYLGIVQHDRLLSHLAGAAA